MAEWVPWTMWSGPEGSYGRTEYIAINVTDGKQAVPLYPRPAQLVPSLYSRGTHMDMR